MGLFMTHQATFSEAVEAKATALAGQDELDLANQLRAAADVIASNDVAHVSSAIGALTAERIVQGTKISPDAIVLREVKRILREIAENPTADVFPQFIAKN